MVIWLANCGTTGVPPATLGPPVTYGDSRPGAPGGVVAGSARAAGLTDPAASVCLGFGFGLDLGSGAVTTIFGSCVSPDGAAVGAASLGVSVSPAAGAGDAGAVVAGESLPGCGCGVCASAPAQRDEIRNDVDASNRGRNDTATPW